MKWKTFGNIPSMACIQTSKVLSLASIMPSFSWLYWEFQDCVHWWFCCNLLSVLLIKLSVELNVYGCTVIEIWNLLLLSIAQLTLYFVDWELVLDLTTFLNWSEPPCCSYRSNPWLHLGSPPATGWWSSPLMKRNQGRSHIPTTSPVPPP